jgi:hypothetical protein
VSKQEQQGSRSSEGLAALKKNPDQDVYSGYPPHRAIFDLFTLQRINVQAAGTLVGGAPVALRRWKNNPAQGEDISDALALRYGSALIH